MIQPAKLSQGSGMRVIAPARSLALLSEETQNNANKRITEIGLTLSFGEHVRERDAFISSSIQSRVADIHAGFLDPSVQYLSTVIGGYNSNQLLSYLDYDLIRTHPKIFCGYSDITALSNAIYAKTGLITYSGPHYANFGDLMGFDYSLEYLKKCLFTDESFEVLPSPHWNNDEWWIDQRRRIDIPNVGFITIQPGEATGTVVGGNLRTFHYLAGTEYCPSLENSILFIEEDLCEDILHFDSHLTAISQLPNFNGVKGIIIGRFQPQSNVTIETLKLVIANNSQLQNIPIIYGVDFGHTEPKITFPIGGTCSMVASDKPTLYFEKH